MAESMDTSEVTLPDEDDRKLFVGGLPQVMDEIYWNLDQLFHKRSIGGIANRCIQDAKQDDISAHFQSFGELDNINLKTDPATGRSRRGVVFAPVSTAQAEGEMFNV